jgi:hypothetical protein
MKKVEVFHPTGQWVEVYYGDCEETIQAFLDRFCGDMKLRCRVVLAN